MTSLKLESKWERAKEKCSDIAINVKEKTMIFVGEQDNDGKHS